MNKDQFESGSVQCSRYKETKAAVQNERLTGRREQEQGNYIREKKWELVITRLLSFRGWQGLLGRLSN